MNAVLVAELLATERFVGIRENPRWSRIGGNATTAHWSLKIGLARSFVKTVRVSDTDALAAEADALHAIAGSGAVRVPVVYAQGIAEGTAFLALEWLDIVDGGRGAALGRGLAKMHAVTGPQFGWHRDNTIGPTPQPNAWCDDWAEFFRDRRLRPQLELAARNGYRGALEHRGEKLLDAIPRLLRGHRPAASLLHGDLWAGNAGRLADGTPVLYDPATYYGDHEADLAMTELFGGFGADFYAAHAEALPVDNGYPVRRTLYNLYHVINHLNLFGESYRARAEAMVSELASHAR
ncbi:MAG: fructosamine kinase family protein [Sphingomicrobium sp.]